MPFGFGRGKGRRFCGRGPSRFGPLDKSPANCICPKCGKVVPHCSGIPCFRTKCPECGSLMTRQFFTENR